ncbi:hypothetical protein [Roseobacter sp. A03A-229]
MGRLILFLICFGAIPSGSVAADHCGGSYVIVSGDSLSRIADRLYKDARQWTRIYVHNRDAIGEDPDKILVGDQLELICIDGRPTGLATGISDDPDPATTAAYEPSVQPAAFDATTILERPIRMVATEDQAPFSDRSLPSGGLVSELIAAALQVARPETPVDRSTVRELVALDASSSSSDPTDVFYPWMRPDCAARPAEPLCADYLYTDPLFEIVMMLYVEASSTTPLLEPMTMRGMRLCRVAGLPVFMLDEDGRNWLRDGQVEMLHARTLEACFDHLSNGEVDAVVANEFAGRAAASKKAATGHRLTGLPFDTVTLHAVVSRDTPGAQALLADMNAGLREIRHSGGYQNILDRHLTQAWAGL